MNRLQRVLKAINNQIPDRVPWGEIHLPPGLVSRAVGQYSSFQEGLLNKKRFLDRFNHDLLVLDLYSPISRMQEEIDFWLNRTDVFIFLLLTGGFTRFVRKMGWKESFLTLAERPKKAAEVIYRENRQMLQEALPLLNRGGVGVIIGDDLAGNSGPLVDPGFLQAEVFSSLKQTVDDLKAVSDRPVLFHSDGNVTGLIELVIDAGFDGLQGMEPAAGLDIEMVKQQYGGRLCLMGNLDLDCLLVGSDEELERQVARVMQAGAPGGGFIFSTSGGLVEEISIERLEKLSKYVSKYGGY